MRFLGILLLISMCFGCVRYYEWEATLKEVPNESNKNESIELEYDQVYTKANCPKDSLTYKYFSWCVNRTVLEPDEKSEKEAEEYFKKKYGDEYEIISIDFLGNRY